MRIRMFNAAAALTAGVLLLSACGGDSPVEGKTGSEVAALAADALEEAGAVRLTGSVTQDGEKTEIDLRLREDRAAGTVTIQGTEIELISVDGDVHLKATDGLLDALGAPGEAVAQFEGRWIMVPAEGAADFADLTLDGLLEELRSPSDMDEEETRSEKLDGDDVVIVEEENGPTFFVADDDPPNLLQIRDYGDFEGTLSLSDHGEKQDIEAPDDVISPEELQAS